MKKKLNLTEEQKLLLPSVLIGVACVVIAVLIAWVQEVPITDYTAATLELGEDLFSAGIVLLLSICIAIFLGWLIQNVNWEVMKSATKRLGKDLSNSILAQNAEIVSVRLKYFLFNVLHRNNEVLHLPLGEDFGCLSPRELSYGCRSNCVIYHFDLIAPNKPEMDLDTLRKVIQEYIVGELHNRGIMCLDHTFHSKVMNCNLWSVYLDRITYYETQHRLSFELLYICTEKSAAYLVKAIQRDKTRVQPEVEVFDDDL